MTKYAVIAKCKEMRSSFGSIMTSENSSIWVCDEYWAGATGVLFEGYDIPQYIARRLKTFDSLKEAKNFMKKWKGHPWYYVPKEWAVVEVEPNMVQEGWRPQDEQINQARFMS